MKSKIVVLCILLLAAALRLYKLGDLPRGLYIDEVSLGYNAWSVLKTGKDEHQVFFPFQFQAFGEYKLPVYLYASMPLISLFGLNAFSIRLLSALAGICAVWGIYLLTRKILSNKNYKYPESAALLAAAFLAVSPWSLQFSRGAFEANVAVTLVIFAMYFVFKYLENSTKRRYLVLAITCFILGLYTYNAERIIIPVLVVGILLLFWKKLSLLENKRIVSVSFGILFIIIASALLGSVFGNESARVREVFELENKQYYLGALLGVLQKYLTHFSANFLFFEGDIVVRHSVREVGEMFLSQLPFMVIGLIILAREKTQQSKLLLLWLVVAPFPAGLATPVPHALRSLPLLVPLTIATAVGITESIIWLNRHIVAYKKVSIIGLQFTLVILFTFSFVTYLHVYYKHYVYKTSWDWAENQTLLGEVIARDYSTKKKILIEADPKTMEYIRFFNASQNNFTKDSRYIFYTESAPIKPQNGDIVVINGWKGTPDQFKYPQELKMSNNSIGFKIGEWQE